MHRIVVRYDALDVSTSPQQRRSTSIHEDREQPGAKARLHIVGCQRAICAQQRLLSCILRVMPVAEHAHREAQARLQMAIDEQRECPWVSVEYATHEGC